MLCRREERRGFYMFSIVDYESVDRNDGGFF